jgi:hypothetical protein
LVEQELQFSGYKRAYSPVNFTLTCSLQCDRMKVFIGTAVLLSLVVVAAPDVHVTKETASEDKMSEMKREWLGNFCKEECNKLKCQNFHPVPANEQCICMSCDLGDVGQLAELGPESSKDPEGHGKPRMRNVLLNVTTANPTIDGKMLPIGENHNMTLTNATCNLECSRLDCTHFTASEKIDNCLCHNCDLEVGKRSTGQDIGRSNRNKQGSSSNCQDCHLDRDHRRRKVRSHICTGGWWWRRRCYYRNIGIGSCGGNAGDTSSPDFGGCSTSNNG